MQEHATKKKKKPQHNQAKNKGEGEMEAERLVLNYKSAFNLATNTMYCATKIVLH